MIFLQIKAAPLRTEKGWVWYHDGGNENLCQPLEGIIPIALAMYIQGSMLPPKGMGGKWFPTHEEAVQAMEKALNFYLAGKITLV